jgi:hypothetical protein
LGRLASVEEGGTVRFEPEEDSIVAVSVQSYGSRHHVEFDIGNGSRVHVLTGVVIFTFQGRGNEFIRDTLTFEVPIQGLPAGKGLRVVQWAPFVTPASIGNEGPALNLGWAVDGFRLENTGPVISAAMVTCNLAVRDPGSYLYRVAYSLHVTGQLDDLP